MQWWPEFLHLKPAVMFFELFNPEHWPTFTNKKHCRWMFAGLHKFIDCSFTFRCEHCHYSSGKQEGPVGRYCPWRRSHWGMLLTFSFNHGASSYWVQLNLGWSLAMMSEFLHLNPLCWTKHTSFLTLSRDHKNAFIFFYFGTLICILLWFPHAVVPLLF